MGKGREWYKLSSCVWNAPFELTGYVDISRIYPDLENFFLNRLKIKTASPAMLINELANMAKEDSPRIADIHRRIVEVGLIIAKSSHDESLDEAIKTLHEVDFLPKKDKKGNLILVGISDEFAILDHERFGAAFSDQSVLLDLSLEETQSLHTLFTYLDLTGRYLSESVEIDTSVGEGALESEVLSQELRSKAYALYW